MLGTVRGETRDTFTMGVKIEDPRPEVDVVNEGCRKVTLQ